MTSKAKKETELSRTKDLVKELRNQVIAAKIKIGLLEDKNEEVNLQLEASSIRMKRIESDLRLIWNIVDPD